MIVKMEKRIFLASPHMSEEGYEKEYIKEAFDTNWVAPLGPNVTGFEQDLENYFSDNAHVYISQMIAHSNFQKSIVSSLSSYRTTTILPVSNLCFSL